MRVLHLVQPLAAADHWLFSKQAGASGEAALLMLRDVIADAGSVQSSHHVIVMGGSASRELAKSVGLRDFLHVAPALGRASRCGPALRAALPAFGKLDAIVAWGHSAAAVLPKLLVQAETSHFCVDIASGQLSIGETPSENNSVALPWLTAGKNLVSDASSKHRFAIPEDEVSVLVMSDDACPAFAPDCVLSLLSLAVCDHPVTLLLPRSAEDFTRALRSAQDGTYVHRVVPTTPDISQRELLNAANVAMIMPHRYSMPGLKLAEREDGEPVLPAARFWLEATRAGVPVIVPRAIAAWMGVEEVACVAESARAADMTKALLPLLESPEARKDAVGRAARVLQDRGRLMNANEGLVRAMEHLEAMGTSRLAL